MKIGIIGLGKMGEALASGIRQSEHSKGYTLIATTQSQASASEASKRLKIPVHTDNEKLAQQADILILCVKPHQAQSVLSQISHKLTKKHHLISICAAITTEQLSEWSGRKPSIVRAMPNTPCLIGEGMTVLCEAQSGALAGKGSASKSSAVKAAEKIFNTVGKTAVVEERLMDGVTGLSGCGPAYIYLIIEALSEAGVKVGISRDVATLLAAQTLMGAAKMVLEKGDHPAALKDEVTTPAGCTIDGLMALEEGKLRVTLIKAVLAATERSKTMR